jgi:hypothetical protein
MREDLLVYCKDKLIIYILAKQLLEFGLSLRVLVNSHLAQWIFNKVDHVKADVNRRMNV